MQEEPGNLKQTIENVSGYLNAQKDIVKLKAIRSGSGITARIVSYLIVAMLLLVAYVFLNITAGFLLAECFHSLTYGFLSVTGINVLLGIVLYVFRKNMVIKPLQNALISMLTNNEEDGSL